MKDAIELISIVCQKSLLSLLFVLFISFLVIVVESKIDGFAEDFKYQLGINFHINNGFALLGLFIGNYQNITLLIAVSSLLFYFLEIYIRHRTSENIRKSRSIKIMRLCVVVLGIIGQFVANSFTTQPTKALAESNHAVHAIVSLTVSLLEYGVDAE